MKKVFKFQGEEQRKFADNGGFPYPSLHELAQPYDAKKSEYEKGLFLVKLRAKEQARLIKSQQLQTKINVLEVKRKALLYPKPTMESIVIDYRNQVENYDVDDITSQQVKFVLNAQYNVLLEQHGAKEITNVVGEEEENSNFEED